MSADPRFAEPVGDNEVAGLAVAFKALLVRAGGRVEITEAELLHARTMLARVSADPERMVVELVDGAPPDVPRFDADAEPAERAEREALAILRDADSAFGPVADTLEALADDPTVTPAVYDRVCSALFAVLNAWAELNEWREANPALGEVDGRLDGDAAGPHDNGESPSDDPESGFDQGYTREGDA